MLGEVWEVWEVKKTITLSQGALRVVRVVRKNYCTITRGDKGVKRGNFKKTIVLSQLSPDFRMTGLTHSDI